MTYEWGHAEAERLGELHTIHSEQYGVPCVVVFPGYSADDVIKHCRFMGAIYSDGCDKDFCVVLRFDVGPELYSESALRGSLPLPEPPASAKP